MAKRITLIQGHPDAQAYHFCHALADEYLKGAEIRGYEVRCIDVAAMDAKDAEARRTWQLMKDG